jgi:hypothetical protein
VLREFDQGANGVDSVSVISNGSTARVFDADGSDFV